MVAKQHPDPKQQPNTQILQPPKQPVKPAKLKKLEKWERIQHFEKAARKRKIYLAEAVMTISRFVKYRWWNGKQ